MVTQLCSWSFTSLSSVLPAVFLSAFALLKPCSWAEVGWQPKMLNTEIWWYLTFYLLLFCCCCCFCYFAIWHHLSVSYANYAASCWNFFFHSYSFMLSGKNIWRHGLSCTQYCLSCTQVYHASTRYVLDYIS